MMSTSLLFKIISQTITAIIYDKASSMTHLLTSGANALEALCDYALYKSTFTLHSGVYLCKMTIF